MFLTELGRQCERDGPQGGRILVRMWQLDSRVELRKRSRGCLGYRRTSWGGLDPLDSLLNNCGGGDARHWIMPGATKIPSQI